jgi:predicted nucleic acid-binding protein
VSKLVYLDTSALAKLFLNEPSSPRFGIFFREQIRPPAVSTLAMIELHCLLSRRKRAGEIDPAAAQAALAEFEKLIRFELLQACPLDDSHGHAAIDLLLRLPEHPLRTLDALHLAIARSLQADTIATADRVLGEAARSLRFKVEMFV